MKTITHRVFTRVIPWPYKTCSGCQIKFEQIEPQQTLCPQCSGYLHNHDAVMAFVALFGKPEPMNGKPLKRTVNAHIIVAALGGRKSGNGWICHCLSAQRQKTKSLSYGQKWHNADSLFRRLFPGCRY